MGITTPQVPHHVQMSMSKEKTPMLSGSIPAFETFMWEWEVLAEKHPHLKPWIDVGLKWAGDYYICMDCTSSYIIAMHNQQSSCIFSQFANLCDVSS
jgi:hypothetical protein